MNRFHYKHINKFNFDLQDHVTIIPELLFVKMYSKEIHKLLCRFPNNITTFKNWPDVGHHV